MNRLLCLLLLLPTPLVAAEQQWMTVLLDGRKVGHSVSERQTIDGRVHSNQRLELTLERSGTRLTLVSDETSIETPEGEPLGFRGEVLLGGDRRRYSGEIDGDGTLQVWLEGIGARDERSQPWPEGALLAEGQRMALAAAAAEEGQRLSLSIFLPDALQAAGLELLFGAEEAIEMPEVGRVRLRRIEQRLDIGQGDLPTEAWMDESRRIRRMRMPLFGTFLDMLECSRECALAPVQPADMMQRTLVEAPRGMGRLRPGRAMRYQLRAKDGGAIGIVQSAEQRVREDGDVWLVTVRPGDSQSGEAEPDPALLQPNRWIESDAGEIRAMAATAAAGSTDDLSTMRRLEAAVREHIEVKSLRVGYASALETWHRREGDCTEHAVLLAALGRARGIPTRIATGLVHADRFGGQSNVFVPHAWTQAWIDGRWISFDAAQDGHGAGHIQLGSGDGEPWQFYHGINQLGRLAIESAQPLR
jgi:hypothetical protein